MTTPYAPTPRVEVAFGYGPYESVRPGDWVDISADVFEVTVTRGRASEFEQFPPSTATIVLRNDARQYDPLNTAGTHYGDLLPNVPVRILGDLPEPHVVYRDDFSGSTLGREWDLRQGAVSITGGKLVIPSRAGLVLPPVESTGSALIVEMIKGDGDLYVGAAGPDVYLGPTGSIGTDWYATLRLAASLSAGVYPFGGGGTSIAYNSTTHRWWRFEHLPATGVFIFQTSPDGATWTTRFTKTDDPSMVSSYWRPIIQTVSAAATTGYEIGEVRIERSTMPVWRGLVDAWPAEYHEGGYYSEVTVQATDAFKVLAERPMPDTFVDELSTLGVKRGWWRMDRIDAGFLPNAVADAPDAAIDTALSTTDGLVPVSTTAVRIPARKPDLNTYLAAASVPIPRLANDLLTGTTYSIAVVVQFDGPSPVTGLFSSVASTDQVLITLYVSATGVPTFTFNGVGASVSAFPSPAVLAALGITVNMFDGKVHRIVGVRSGTSGYMYVDGVYVGGASNALANNYYNMSAGNHSIARTGLGDGTTTYSSFVMDELMLFDAALSAGQVATLDAALMVGFSAPRPSGSVVDEVLDLIAWPSELRDIDTGEINVRPPANPTGTSGLELLQTVAATEGARLFIDADGRVAFRDRASFLTDPAESTVQYTFSDIDRDTTPPDVGTIEGSLRVTLDDRFTYQAAEVEREGGYLQRAELVANPTRTWKADGLLFTDDLQSLNLAEWITFRYGSPQARSDEWGVDPEVLPDDWPELLALELGHRIKHDVTPGGIGSSIDLEQHLEVIGHQITPETWTLTMNGIPVDPNNYLIWADVDGITDNDHGWADTDGTPPGGAWG